MPRPWRLLAAEDTPEGKLELRQRGDAEFLLQVGGRVLMNSAARKSEELLATMATERIAAVRAPAVLIGGLGMGYTLRAALDTLPKSATVVVAELNPVMVAWCAGPLAALTGAATADPRVRVEIADVARLISSATPASLHAIVLDLYEGPRAATQRADDPFYGVSALRRARAALAPGGVLAVWAEAHDAAFEKRFAAVGFDVTTCAKTPGGAGWKHTVYVGVRVGR
jgi:spermidine synthase